MAGCDPRLSRSPGIDGSDLVTSVEMVAESGSDIEVSGREERSGASGNGVGDGRGIGGSTGSCV